MYPCSFHSTTAALRRDRECHLDDEEECRGRVEGSVVQRDDGGAMRAEKVPNLQGRHSENICVPLLTN